jgi:superfamily II DNA/RNA helicase
VPPHVIARLTRLKLHEPTRVQRVALEALMPNHGSSAVATAPARHAVIRWPTGSGKTLAFGLPLLSRIDIHACGNGLQALVLSPTRELCLQTYQTLKRLVGHGRANRKGHSIKIMPLLGRRTPRLAIELARHPPDVAVGTPHTIGGLLKAGLLPLSDDSKSRTLVLDEVGALMEPFRWPEVMSVLEGVDVAVSAAHGSLKQRSPSRGPWAGGAVWFVSADVPVGAVDRCLSSIVGRGDTDPQVGNASERIQTTGTATPPALVLEPAERLPGTLRHVAIAPPAPQLGALLASILSRRGGGDSQNRSSPVCEARAETGATAAAEMPQQPREDNGTLYGSARATLVFVKSGAAADDVCRKMKNRRIRAGAIHGGDGDARAGHHRERGVALREFEGGKLRVLAATEMLAYGVDIRGATHVVNADIPERSASYLHRAGRVGRTGGAPGTIISLPRNEGEMSRLRNIASELGFALEVEAAPPPAPPARPGRDHL